MQRRIIYLCGARNFTSNVPGRKIQDLVNCWRANGHDVVHVCGGDILKPISHGSPKEYGASSFYRQWYRRLRAFQPLIHTASERLDIHHDAAMLDYLQNLCQSFHPSLVWERSSRLHCAGLALARRRGLPYVLEWKDHLVDYRFSLFRRRALAMEDWKCRDADYIVVESGVLRDQLMSEGYDGNKILVAHNAAETGEFSRDFGKRAEARQRLGISDETVLVGYLGSYAFYHDSARLVLAADVLRRTGSPNQIRFLMVGAGKEYEATKALAESIGLLGNLLMMEPGVRKEDVPGILAALDIAVLPGSTDIICPIKIQEYMACELPSVAPDYACIREVLRHGKTGMLFRPRDETSLAEQISLLATNADLRNTQGRNARQDLINRFTWKATWGAALETILKREACKRASTAMPIDKAN